MAAVTPRKPFSLVGWEDTEQFCMLAANTPHGAFVEVGVYRGGTAWELNEVAKRQGRKLFLYDTFSGIPFSEPEKGDSHIVGDFSDTSEAEVRAAVPEAVVVRGIFPESAVEMGPIAFVHLDVDQYKSYKEAIAYLRPRMVGGGIMWFDDYGCLDGATRAVNEEFGGSLLKAGNKHYVKF